MDTLSSWERSRVMSLVKSKDTRPELAVRKLISALGYRYRIHERGLPGNPDIIFRSRKKAIFVHGCFWHQHKKCSLVRLPKSKKQYWLAKLEGNAKRDRRNIRALRALGWRSLVIWECMIKNPAALATKIHEFLSLE